jgi:pimeloyl-ACP methyl ester carboxylesterase
MSRVVTGGGEAPPLYVEASGAGENVLLAHGFGGSARNFRPQLRALRGRYRTIVYDARGHARSGAPEAAADYTPECFVSDLGRVLDQAGSERAVVGGLSMGPASRCASRSRIRSACRGWCWRRSAGAGLVPPRAAGFARARPRSLLAAGQRFVWGGSGSQREATLMKQGFRGTMPRSRVLRRLIAGSPASDASRELRRVICGAGRGRRATRRRCGGRSSQELPRAARGGGGRQPLVNLEQPEAFNAALLGFLAEEVFPRPG